ncbi:hypothetical protein D9Q98_003038 [Chlorella vulgaris]|uniref:Uncharacterized protein n=1 Tax=Chlorella vulgaris TaxID=3077 RepID=A0A9D4TUQ5_CHLVU|nr:hypothetical protein D9Q98_003038 [Chlorella vulgaris]
MDQAADQGPAVELAAAAAEAAAPPAEAEAEEEADPVLVARIHDLEAQLAMVNARNVALETQYQSLMVMMAGRSPIWLQKLLAAVHDTGLLLLCWLVVAVLATVTIIIAYKKGHFEGVARVEVVFSLVQSVISAGFVAFKLLRKG